MSSDWTLGVKKLKKNCLKLCMVLEMHLLIYVSDVHVDVACKYQRSEPMFAFAFRTHAHTLGELLKTC